MEKIIRVGLASCGIAAGAQKIYDYFKENVKDDIAKIYKSGCIGMCFNEPLVEVNDSTGLYLYGNIDEKKAKRIIDEHVQGGQPVEEFLVFTDKGNTDDGDFLTKQQRILLKNSGTIDPESISSYISVGGYEGLKKAVTEMTPEEVIEEVEKSGLRGRGGAGFPTFLKWKFTRQSQNFPKYVVCNADEGDPGAFMDRSILESDPHSLLEGMAIAAYAIGASEGYIYIRAEYPLAVKRLKMAIEQAEEKGYLGNNILNTDFNFTIEIREGAGAFVCGEETALIASVEGQRGMPRFKPPFPAQKGLWSQPTAINNVETLANVSRVLYLGADAYSKYGTEKSKGTKVFALAGKVERGGLVEIPMGTTIRDIVFNIGGGISSGKPFKAIQTGGPSGGCIPASMADTPVDYESLKQIGAIMGSGGLLVMDEDTCMVDVARFFLRFTTEESCGKCTFCRIGTKQMLDILDRIAEGKGEIEDLDRLEKLAHNIIKGSLCGLGQTAPNPVITTLKYFRDEYLAHVTEKRCPAKKCKELISFRVIEENCTGCGVCKRQCPVNAISGEKKQPHFIDSSKCIRCRLCYSACKFNAIEIYSDGIKKDTDSSAGGRGQAWNK
jgi:NADH-quinone oxidoreductase subunit F